MLSAAYLVNIKLMPFRLHSQSSGTDQTLTQKHTKYISYTHIHSPTRSSHSESFNYSKGSR